MDLDNLSQVDTVTLSTDNFLKVSLTSFENDQKSSEVYQNIGITELITFLAPSSSSNP